MEVETLLLIGQGYVKDYVDKEVANLVNERPIDLKPNLEMDQAYFGPNSLLLGRSCNRTNAGPF